MRMKMSLKFDEELANKDGVDISQFKEIIDNTFAREGIVKEKDGEFVAPDTKKDYFCNFGKVLRDLSSYEWAHTYLSEWTWHVDHCNENVLDTLKKYRGFLLGESAKQKANCF